jgi:hypothetical protein
MKTFDLNVQMLERFKNDPVAVKELLEGIQKLKSSGIGNLLRMFGRPYAIDRGKDVQASAYLAAFCEGYNKCLDDLLFFEEMYLTEYVQPKSGLSPTFGALEILKQKEKA